jgi:hypothetical protein
LSKPNPSSERDANSRLQSLRFLKPTNPQEALALVLLCSTLLALGGGALKVLENLLATDPWEVRADQVCLDEGSKYLNVKGNPTSRLQQQIEVTETALDYLTAIGNSVPLSSTLQYQTMIGDKEEFLRLLKRELHLSLEGRPTMGPKERAESVFLYSYGPHAEELGLNVCGQGSGNQ